MAHLASHYHEGVDRLDGGRAELEAAARARPTVPVLVALARISYVWGDVRATGRDAKLAAYERGRQAADEAFKLDPASADARYWRAVNLGRWAETKGVFSALAEVTTLRDEMQAILRFHPAYTDAYGFLGSYYCELPWLIGGDVDKALGMFGKGLALEPRATGQRVGLAKALIKKGRLEDARAELQRVLDEKTPSNPAEWRLRDVAEARKLLETLAERR
jgi:tetratricopeptide (TPR) repeat protein